ncbi:MAG: hypothetical protein N3D84_01725 [Candidatus Woesearchaeota archaeon]|nr:hypothetical protein [Candidatus Woesearchaeota archaeon]
MALNQVLVDYIQNQIRKGYDIETIRNFLISQGYNADEVNSCIDFITKDRINSLVNYIKQEMKAGGSRQEIMSRLVSFGYKDDEVSKAMEKVGKKFPNYAIIAVLIVLAAIGFSMFYTSTSPSPTIVETKQIIKQTGKTVPAAIPIAQADKEPLILANETEAPVEKKEEIKKEEFTPTRYEVIDSTKDSKIIRAVEMCSNTANDIYRDACFDQLAKATRDHTLCARIIDSVQKDKCYKRTAAWTGNKALCDNIVDPQMRSECQLYEYV